MFDLAVNGGGFLTLNYERPGYCSIQRQVATPWNDYQCLPDAVMITMDPVATEIAFGDEKNGEGLLNYINLCRPCGALA